MNERLNQEIRDYIGAQKSDVFRDVAEHFYNFALKDVRKEMKIRADKLDDESLPPDRETILLKMCKANAFREVILFIDRLTK